MVKENRDGLAARKVSPKLIVAFSLLLLRSAASAQVGDQGNKHDLSLNLDQVLACTSGLAENLLGQSVDKLREADPSPELKLENGIVIHWSMSGDPRPAHDLSKDDHHFVESSKETGFCRTAGLNLIEVPRSQRYLDLTTNKVIESDSPPVSNGKVISLAESNLFVSQIVRDGQEYKLSPHQIYSGNHRFSQEKGVFKNSDQQFLLITLDPVQCDMAFHPTDGGPDAHVAITKSKIGLELQWRSDGKPDEWEFYRAIYSSPGCPSS